MAQIDSRTPIFARDFDFDASLAVAGRQGYSFAHNAFTDQICEALIQEMDEVGLVLGDHTSDPINNGAPNEVRQRHSRFYTSTLDDRVPAARMVSRYVSFMAMSFQRELGDWAPTEIGYQRYMGEGDWISPHRDRATDRYLAVTATMGGCALINIYRTNDNPLDYSQRNLTLVDEFKTSPGSIMLLRAPGFGSGKQVVHEVMPPENGPRDILNLRMRPDVLPQPQDP